MSQTVVATANRVQKWSKQYFVEYVRDSLFAPYMGDSENSIIQLIEELGTGAGKTVNVPLVTRLLNAGVTGDNTLEGNEEALSNYNHAIDIDQIRNAVVVGKMEQKSTEIDILEAGRTHLKLWSMDDLRDDIIQAMYCAHTDGVTAYASLTEAQKDAWVAYQNPTSANQRVLFGNAHANYSSGDHSASLANVDSVNDTLDFDIVQLMKRDVKKVDPHIRPVKLKGGREFYVLFCESYGFRDLKVDTETMHTNAGVRGEDNPLFQDPDLMLDGVVCREVPEIAALTGVGASSIDVGAHFFCGAQALGIAWGQRPKFVTRTDIDWDNQKGVAINEVRGVEKLHYNNVQHGMGTIYAAAVADS